MPFRGFSCPTAEFCGFFTSELRDVLVLFLGSSTVDKSVRRPNWRINCQVTGESAFQRCRARRAALTVFDGASISLGHRRSGSLRPRQRRLPFADPAFGQRCPRRRSQSRLVRNHPSRRRCRRLDCGPLREDTGPASFGASSRNPQCASRPVSAKDGRRAKQVPQWPLARPIQPRIGKQKEPSASAYPLIEMRRALPPAAQADGPSATDEPG